MIASDVVQSRMTPEGKTVYSLGCWAKPNREDAYINYQLYFSGNRFDGLFKHIRKGTRLVVTGTPRVHMYFKKDHTCASVFRIFVDSMEFAPSLSQKSDNCEESAGNGTSVDNGSVDNVVSMEAPVEGTIEAPLPFDLDEVPF